MNRTKLNIRVAYAGVWMIWIACAFALTCAIQSAVLIGVGSDYLANCPHIIP